MSAPPDIFTPVKIKKKVKPVDPGKPVWKTDGKDWPNRAVSKFVTVAGIRWHVQEMGEGPVAVLIHGTGAATHSWRDLMPALAARFTVVAFDLPGHGFTGASRQDAMALPRMAASVAKLIRRLGHEPAIVVGHSAGAAIAVQMCLTGAIMPKAMVSLNGALMPLPAPVVARPFLATLGRLFARNTLVPKLFAWRAGDPAVVAKLLAGTGSKIGPEGLKFYAILARRSGHAAAALTMMAGWDIEGLGPSLAILQPRLLLVVGANDRSIPPADAARVHRMLHTSRVVTMPGLGHLAHEEAPAETAALIIGFAEETGVLPA